ncbi:MAG TPA: MOSC N-terminal beta barrel domain-containing protein [Acidimicrobiales bacterium]|nr:MOSC N-terminal beta barrel domain-containing protein [Acidimicrobiales bacterium]
MATVLRLGRYPVKSFQGETLDSADVTDRGVPGDRRWAVVDQATGKALSAKREGRLLAAEARTDPRSGRGPDGGTVIVRLPDGREHEAGDPGLDKAASAWLDRDVRVEQARDDVPRVYEFNISSEDESSPLLDIPCPTGTFLDLAAVHILTTASLRAIAALYPDGAWELPRFRPTVVVEADGDEFVEDEWIGRAVRIGGAGGVVLNPFMPTVRCTMTTRAQLGLPRDLDIAKTVNRQHGGSLGIYCTVVEPGRVSVGDALTVG